MFLHGFAYTNGAPNLSHLSKTLAELNDFQIKDGKLAAILSSTSQQKQKVKLNKCNGSISQSSKLAECTIPEIQSNQNLKMAA